MTAEALPAVLIDEGNGVVWATINRPATRNAINTDVVQGLKEAVRRAELTEANALVLRGANGNFSSGADLDFLSSARSDADPLPGFIAELGDVLTSLESGPFVSVAIVEGYAVAGGCELLMSCDIAVAADDAQLGDRHLEFGLVPGAGGSVRLHRDLAGARARYLLFTGNMISGRTAADWGLVSFSVPGDELEQAVESLVTRLVQRGHGSIGTAKRMMMAANSFPFADALGREREMFLDYFRTSDDVSEGLLAFGERRAPRFGTLSPRGDVPSSGS